MDDDLSEDSEEEKKMPAVFTLMPKKQYLRATVKESENLQTLKKNAKAAARLADTNIDSSKIFSPTSPRQDMKTYINHYRNKLFNKKFKS